MESKGTKAAKIEAADKAARLASVEYNKVRDAYRAGLVSDEAFLAARAAEKAAIEAWEASL